MIVSAHLQQVRILFLRILWMHLHWYWGGFDSYAWQTGALDSGGSPYYPSGTYSVYAESTLHGMKDNYKNGGADYTTKTVSQTVTVALVSQHRED